MTRFTPIPQAPDLPFAIAVVTPRLIVPAMLPDHGPLMKLWRRDPVSRAAHLVAVDYHVGFDYETGEIATMVQPLLVANPKGLPA